MKTLLVLLAIAVAYDGYTHKSVQRYCSYWGNDSYRLCMGKFDQSILPWGQ